MKSQDEWVISSSNRNIKSGIIEVIESRAVLYALVKRELKSRYRANILGFIWALGKPLSLLAVYSLVIGEILGASKSIEFFALYLFVGLMFWGFFAESVLVGTNSVVNATGLVQKISFPREILPISAVIVAAFNTLVQIPVLILGYIIFGKWPDPTELVFLIPILGILIFMALGLGLLLGATNVYVRDIQPLTDLVIMLLMYATPIIYSWTFVREVVVAKFGDLTLFNLYVHNPISTVTISIQDILWPGTRAYSDGTAAPDLFNFGSPAIWIMLFCSLFFLLGSYNYFLKLEPNFAREL